jgi:hypothetical protein
LEKSGREVRPVDVSELDHPLAVVDDLADPRNERLWASGARALVHLAGVPDPTASWEEVEAANVVSTRKMVEIARRHGIERLVLGSSVWAMRRRWDEGGLVGTGPAKPSNTAYARSKASAEAIAAEAVSDVLSVVVLRIGGRAPGDARPVRINEWEDACWLGWQDFFQGMDRALDASVEGIATVTLVSNNPAGRWSLDEGRDLIGYDPVEHYDPAPRPGLLARVRRRLPRIF